MINFCHSLNFHNWTSSGYCGKTAHEYGNSHSTYEIGLVQGFKKASRFWKSLIGYLTTTIMILIYKWASFEFCAEVLIFLMNFFSSNEVFQRFWHNKNPAHLKLEDQKFWKFLLRIARCLLSKYTKNFLTSFKPLFSMN